MKKCILLAVCLALLLCGCGGEAQPTQPMETTAPPTTLPAETTEAPTGMHSGINADGVFTEGTLLVGDALMASFVEDYLLSEERLDQAHYMTAQRVSVSSFLRTNNREGCSQELMGKSWQDVIAHGGEYSAIYLLLGTTYESSATTTGYMAILNYLQDRCPDTSIYVMTYPEGMSGAELTNKLVKDACSHYGSGDRVVCLDTGAAIGGRLSGEDEISADGLEAWYEAIVSYMEDNEIEE